VAVSQHTIGRGAIGAVTGRENEGALIALEQKAKAQVTNISIHERAVAQQQHRQDMQSAEARMPAGGAGAKAGQGGAGGANLSGNAEWTAYSNIATAAVGSPVLELFSTAHQILADGADPAAGVVVDGRKIGTFEDMFKSGGAASREGFWGGLEPGNGAQTLGRAQEASYGLGGQSAVKGWDITPQAQFPGVSMHRQLTASYEMQSEQTLGHIRAARLEMGAQQRMMGGPGLNLGLGSGPSGPNFDKPVDDADSDWRSV